MKTIVKMVGLLCVFALAAGCTGYKSYKKAGYSGFLGEYPEFERGREGVQDVWIKKDADWNRYDKIMLDEVVFFFKEDSKYKGITADEMKELSDACAQAYIDAFRDGYTFTDKPGPDVIRLRIAITGVEKSRPVLNTVSTVLPIGIGLSIVNKGVTGEHLSVGNSSMEMEALDSLSSERLAAVVDFRPGAKWEGYTGYGAAKAAFKFWAKRSRARLDELRGTAPEK
ncbi:MAG: DUF3313 domain-containing protein [Deltaproteobacteria bacterium]|nr:DUF3313 domain-containing protein [Deltaproteobacteria bacterium]